MQYKISTHPEYGHRTIRNICITDCSCYEDYYRIIYLCGDYDDETQALAQIYAPTYHINQNFNNFLFDRKSAKSFMYFWVFPATPTTATHHFMTVQEFYAIFDKPPVETSYEYW